jgi:hypothetical protein
MTATLLAANAAWIGLVMALWTKRLWETQGRCGVHVVNREHQAQHAHAEGSALGFLAEARLGPAASVKDARKATALAVAEARGPLYVPKFWNKSLRLSIDLKTRKPECRVDMKRRRVSRPSTGACSYEQCRPQSVGG